MSDLAVYQQSHLSFLCLISLLCKTGVTMLTWWVVVKIERGDMWRRLAAWHVVIGSKQGCANFVARPHLPLYLADSVGLEESQLSDVCTKYTCLFDRAPAGVMVLNQKGKSFSFLISGHLNELMWWLPTVWGVSPSLANYFPNCLPLHYYGLGTCGYGASSCLVICSAKEVLLWQAVWKFFILAVYQHRWNKEMTNICPCLTALPLEILIQEEFVFWKTFAHWIRCTASVRTTGWEMWLRENRVCLHVSSKASIRWPF